MNTFLIAIGVIWGTSMAGIGALVTKHLMHDHLEKLKKEKKARKNLKALLAALGDDTPSDPALDTAFGSDIVAAKNRMWLQGTNPRRDRRYGNPRTNAYRKGNHRPLGYERPPAPPQHQFSQPPRKPA